MTDASGARVLLDVQGLAASYDGWPLFAGVTITLRAGECLVLPDDNDTIRTAFLRTIAGLRERDAGEVVHQGLHAVWHADGLPEDVAVEQTIAAALPQADPRELLRGIGLEHRATHEPWAMSAGERRRVALSIAFADPNAHLLLLDEPERGLDANAIAWTRDRVADRLSGGSAVVIATFDDRIAALGHRTLSLETL